MKDQFLLTYHGMPSGQLTPFNRHLRIFTMFNSVGFLETLFRFLENTLSL